MGPRIVMVLLVAVSLHALLAVALERPEEDSSTPARSLSLSAASQATRTNDLNAIGWTNALLVRPSGRTSHALAYDAQSDRIVLFGGVHGDRAVLLDDTWTYDLNGHSWANLSPAIRPLARHSSAMAYDAQSDRIVLFGGCCPVLSDTWVYDVDTNTWTNMNPLSRPPLRESHAMAYDSQSDRVVLFGGEYLKDTWAYDFESNTWRNMNPAFGPPFAYKHAMAYDAQSDRIILFGGGHDDTWAYDYDSNTWANMYPGSKPSTRLGHAMAYAAGFDRIILFGGSGGYVSGDTWAYDFDRNTWTEMNPEAGPSARSGHAVAYDVESGRVVLFGGITWPELTQSNETWAFSFEANTWASMNPANKHPPPSGNAMASDPSSDQAILCVGTERRGGPHDDA